MPWPILIDFLISLGTQIEFVLPKNQRSSGFISFYLQSCLYILGPLAVFAILSPVLSQHCVSSAASLNRDISLSIDC